MNVTAFFNRIAEDIKLLSLERLERDLVNFRSGKKEDISDVRGKLQSPLNRLSITEAYFFAALAPLFSSLFVFVSPSKEDWDSFCQQFLSETLIHFLLQCNQLARKKMNQTGETGLYGSKSVSKDEHGLDMTNKRAVEIITQITAALLQVFNPLEFFLKNLPLPTPPASPAAATSLSRLLGRSSKPESCSVKELEFRENFRIKNIVDLIHLCFVINNEGRIELSATEINALGGLTETQRKKIFFEMQSAEIPENLRHGGCLQYLSEETHQEFRRRGLLKSHARRLDFGLPEKPDFSVPPSDFMVRNGADGAPPPGGSGLLFSMTRRSSEGSIDISSMCELTLPSPSPAARTPSSARTPSDCYRPLLSSPQSGASFFAGATTATVVYSAVPTSAFLAVRSDAADRAVSLLRCK